MKYCPLGETLPQKRGIKKEESKNKTKAKTYLWQYLSN
jgi:hypothetical protein